MQIQLTALALVLPAWFAPAASAAPFVQGIGPGPGAAADSKTSMFGEPLYVNGRRVTDDEIKLALIYGPGRPMLDMAKVWLIIETESPFVESAPKVFCATPGTPIMPFPSMEMRA